MFAYNRYLKVIEFFNIVITIVVTILALLQNNITAPLWVITLSYTILYILTLDQNQIYFAPGIFLLNIAMFMRYSITILAIYIFGQLDSYANNYNYLTEAVFLMIYEQIGVFFVLYFTGKKERNRIQNIDFHDELILQKVNTGPLIAIIICVVTAGIFMTHQYLVGGISLLIRGTVTSNNGTTTSSGAVSVLWQACLAWIYIYICMRLKEKLDEKSIGISVIVSAIYILLTFIGQSSISRWYTIISFVAVYFVLRKLYPKRKKTIVAFIAVPAILLILVATVYKNTAFLSQGGLMASYIFDMFDPRKLQAYFSGPVNVNNAIGLIHDRHLGISSLPLDVVNNMPIVNHWFDTGMATVNQYNHYIGRYWNGVGDQIIPLVGQSSIYFTYIFAPLLSMIIVKLLRFFDRRYSIANSIDVYVFAFASTWTGVAIILNLTIYLAWFYIRIIPLMVLISLTRILSEGKVRIRRRANNGLY